LRAAAKPQRWFSGLVATALSLLLSALPSAAQTTAPLTFGTTPTTPVFSKLITPLEDAAIGSPDVWIDPALPPGTPQRFVMAYAQGGTDTKGRIGLAYSRDGIEWSRAGLPATILEPAETGWDRHFLDTPCLLRKDGVWYLWYFGATSNKTNGGAIGLATSSDGVHFIRVRTTPVLTVGPAGSWDSDWVESPSVTLSGDQFIMYYTGVGADQRPRMGRATSPDGVNWTKDPANPILSPAAAPQAWDSYAAAQGSIISQAPQTYLVYAAVSLLDMATHQLHPQLGLVPLQAHTERLPNSPAPVITHAQAGSLPNSPLNPAIVYVPEHQQLYIYYETAIGFGLARQQLN